MGKVQLIDRDLKRQIVKRYQDLAVAILGQSYKDIQIAKRLCKKGAYGIEIGTFSHNARDAEVFLKSEWADLLLYFATYDIGDDNGKQTNTRTAN